MRYHAPRLARIRSTLSVGTSRFTDDHPKVDRVAHGCIAGPVGVNLFAGPASRGIRLVFSPDLAGPRVEGDGIEVDHAVEDAGRSDKVVVFLALRVDFRRTVRRDVAVERANHCRHVNPHAWDL